MNTKNFRKAMLKAKRNTDVFKTKASGSVKIEKQGKTFKSRKKVNKTHVVQQTTSIKKTIKKISKEAAKKGYRGKTQKRSKPKTETIKKTQAATKTYIPPKKKYTKPDTGKFKPQKQEHSESSKPKLAFGEAAPDYHVPGVFDTIYTNQGVAGSLNRLEHEYPGTYEMLKTYVDAGDIT